METEKKKEKRDWRDNPLIINLINTLVFGLIIAVITFLLNSKIEKAKIQDSFKSEFNKMKAEKIGETWDKLNVYEAKISMMLELSRRNRNASSKQQEQDSIYVSQWQDDVKGYDYLFIVEGNRFWIGEEQYHLAGQFVELIVRKQDNYLRFNLDSIRIINGLIKNKREKLEIVIQNLLQSD